MSLNSLRITRKNENSSDTYANFVDQILKDVTLTDIHDNYHTRNDQKMRSLGTYRSHKRNASSEQEYDTTKLIDDQATGLKPRMTCGPEMDINELFD